jgi:Flp pilus assembly protein TadB
MEDRDVMMLTEDEQRALDLSFQPGLTENRMRNIVINFFLGLVALVLFAAYRIGLVWISGVAFAILIVSAVEKVSYTRAMLHYKSLVRKLVHRVEQLEGSPSTAMGSHPAERLRRQLELDRPVPHSGA